jgi:hypothetical protein
MNMASGIPVWQQIARTIVTPSFDGSAEKWGSFLWDWTEYIKKVASGKILADGVLLSLFEACIPENLREELKLKKKQTGGKVTYAEFLAQLENRFGRNRGAMMRRNWYDVELRNPGKVTAEAWKEFEVRFRSAWLEVPDSTVQEAYRLLQTKLPQFAMAWVHEREIKMTQGNSILCVIAPPGYTEAEFAEGARRMVGHAPRKVVVEPEGKYSLYFETQEAAEKMLALNGRKMGDSNFRMQVRMVDQNLSPDDIFNLIHQKLLARDRTNAVFSSRGGGGNRNQSGNHNVEAKPQTKTQAVTTESERKAEPVRAAPSPRPPSPRPPTPTPATAPRQPSPARTPATTSPSSPPRNGGQGHGPPPPSRPSSFPNNQNHSMSPQSYSFVVGGKGKGGNDGKGGNWWTYPYQPMQQYPYMHDPYMAYSSSPMPSNQYPPTNPPNQGWNWNQPYGKGIGGGDPTQGWNGKGNKGGKGGQNFFNSGGNGGRGKGGWEWYAQPQQNFQGKGKGKGKGMDGGKGKGKGEPPRVAQPLVI